MGCCPIGNGAIRILDDEIALVKVGQIPIFPRPVNTATISKAQIKIAWIDPACCQITYNLKGVAFALCSNSFCIKKISGYIQCP